MTYIQYIDPLVLSSHGDGLLLLLSLILSLIIHTRTCADARAHTDTDTLARWPNGHWNHAESRAWSSVPLLRYYALLHLFVCFVHTILHSEFTLANFSMRILVNPWHEIKMIVKSVMCRFPILYSYIYNSASYRWYPVPWVFSLSIQCTQKCHCSLCRWYTIWEWCSISKQW